MCGCPGLDTKHVQQRTQCVSVCKCVSCDLSMASWQWKKSTCGETVAAAAAAVLPVCPWRLHVCVCGTVCCSCTPWGCWGRCRSLLHGCQHRKREEWCKMNRGNRHWSLTLSHSLEQLTQSHTGSKRRRLFNQTFSAPEHQNWKLACATDHFPITNTHS